MLLSLTLLLMQPTDFDSQVTHAYADSNGVKIHYAALGDKTKPLIIFIHGFPDFWYTWRSQMAALAGDFPFAGSVDDLAVRLAQTANGRYRCTFDRAGSSTEVVSDYVVLAVPFAVLANVDTSGVEGLCITCGASRSPWNGHRDRA